MASNNETKIVTILGRKGTGKSYATAKLVESYPRKIFFDYANEHSGLFIQPKDFPKFWDHHNDEPEFTIVVKFPPTMDDDEILESVESIVERVYIFGLSDGEPIALVFDEAQFFLPQQYLPPVLKRMLTVGRHANISIFANTQRPALVSKTLISQSDEVYIGQLFLSNDIKALEASIGPIARKAPTLKLGEFIEYRPGDNAEHPKIKKF